MVSSQRIHPPLRIQMRKKQEGGFAASLPSLRVAEFACGSFAYPPKLWADRKVPSEDWTIFVA